ncbi:MAG TPA: HDOD domain-containing protein [Burkholderiaceae bacterium]|nr:HDOD domain-containing protein [Burkholderiaceae bacterium]
MPTPPALQRIREALREDIALPALGQAVSNVSRMAAGESDTVDQLAQAILSDVSLTQRLLRCANSPLYRTRDAAPVTTVSRALMLLGFDQVRSLALSMMLVDHLVPAARARPVMRAFGQALGASSVARCTLQRRWPSCAEEAAIAAMFRNIGRLIATIHAPDAVAAVRDAVAGGQPESQAVRTLVGRSFDELTLEVVSGWGLPARIEQSLQPLGSAPSSPRSSQEWVRLASAFGDESANLARRHGLAGRDRTIATLVRRYGDALDMDAEGIHEVLARADQETLLLAQALGLTDAIADDVPAVPVAAASAGRRAETTREAAGGRSERVDGRGASGAGASRAATPASADASRQLLSTLSRISEALAGSQGIGRVVQIATDALRESLGAMHAVYFARDDAAGTYRPRAAAGCELAALRGRIAMPLQGAPNLFHAALARGADLHIADTGVEAVRNRLPPWLPTVFPEARGFLLLPVTVDGKPMGFFYADRDEAGTAPPDGEQLDAIRLLRNQVVLALRTEPVAR